MRIEWRRSALRTCRRSLGRVPDRGSSRSPRQRICAALSLRCSQGENPRSRADGHLCLESPSRVVREKGPRMKNALEIGTLMNGQKFTLPLDLVTRTLAIIAIRGWGKTIAATVIAEEMC